MRSSLHARTMLEAHLRQGGAVALLLDFDGTLSPLVPLPERAYLPAHTRHTLQMLACRMPVCIITGRPLSVMRKKVGVSGLWYGASHGLEWSFGKTVAARRVPLPVLRALSRIRAAVHKLCVRYPRLIDEPKPYAVTFHYHLLSKQDARVAMGGVKRIAALARAHPKLRVFWDKATIDIVPRLQWTKGDMARHVLQHLGRKHGRRFLPVYIGDSSTDEDAFRALRRGITIRVGKMKGSAAHYYFRSRRGVDLFLAWFSAHAKLEGQGELKGRRKTDMLE